DQNLVSRLESSWPDLLKLNCKGPNGQSFWKYEWMKHGTCSTTPNDYDAYFKLAADLKDEHYVLRTLGQSGIQPAVCTLSGQSTVNIYGVNASIVGATRRQIQIRCKINSTNRKKPRTLLYEIIICYDSTGTTVINCPPPHIGQTCLQSSGQVDFL
ncbi:extracellular ribonuclease LE-like, partial [Olea europaea subsp. europaea]